MEVLDDGVVPVLSDEKWRVVSMREMLRRMRRTRLAGVVMDDDIGELRDEGVRVGLMNYFEIG